MILLGWVASNKLSKAFELWCRGMKDFSLVGRKIINPYQWWLGAQLQPSGGSGFHATSPLKR